MRPFLLLFSLALAACAPGTPVLPVASAPPAPGSATPGPGTPGPAATARPSAGPSATPASAGPAKVSFKADVAPILARSCAGCHAPGKQAVRDLAVFDAAGAVRHDAVAGRVDDVIDETESGGMPRGGRQKLSAEEVALLKRWRDEGLAPD